jgi:predicted ATPase/DNA-binding SARP family transcriptional activator
LGELEVRGADGSEISVSRGKQRAFLALLALRVGRVVPTDQVVDALWGEEPPPQVRNGLQALASKLRGALGAADVVVMRGSGYVLDLPADAIDVHRYEDLVAAGQAAAAHDPKGACVLFAEADALWRGDPLIDFAYDEFAQPTISRLTEMRLAVIEERIDLELALGRTDAGIAELEALVAAQPLRERARGQLMVALYRAGRQADALRTFQEGRHILGEELGLEPGPELRRLEAAILDQDASLDAGVSRGGESGRAQRRGRVPEALNRLVGRNDELQELARLVADERLVSLVGPGGVGKTRLALEIARMRSGSLADGGYVVELAPIGDPAAVRAAIANALDAPDAVCLEEVIGDRELVIVLDNCEHVIEVAAAVADELLRSCPSLQLIATSREALRVNGETVWPVPPLSTDDAVQLFVARTHAAGAPLEVSDELLGVIAEICVRLDGLPLAVELAAARSRALPLRHISSRLHDRFRLLTGGSRNALPRQQTLRAVVDWSYDLLFDAEQRVFERLSVFPGGCDISTAEAVCADELLVASEIADLIQVLVEKSLVVAVRSGDVVRFTQLQTLAQYGHEKLTARGETKRTRDAMSAHFARLCSESKDAFTGAMQGEWLCSINLEQDNLRAALEWAVSNDDAETALVIAGGASWAHWLAGTQTEGARWIDTAFACSAATTDQTRALALTGRGLLRFVAGDIARADDDLHAAREIYVRDNDASGLAFTLSFYAETARLAGRFDEARARRRETLGVYRGAPDDVFVLGARAYSEAILAMLDDDVVEAERCYRTAAEKFGRSRRPAMHAMTLGILADFDERHGRYRDAVDELEQAVALADEFGMRGFAGSLYSRLAWSLLADGDVVRAQQMIQLALDAGRRLRSPHILFLARAGLAVLYRVQGRDSDASNAAEQALEIHRSQGPDRFRNRIDPDFEIASVLAVCQTVLAAVAVEDGEFERAAALLGEADRLRAEVGAHVPKFQADDVQRVRATLANRQGTE